MTSRRGAVVLGSVAALAAASLAWATLGAGEGAPEESPVSTPRDLDVEPAPPARPPRPKVPPDVLLPNLRSDAAFDFRVEGTGSARVLRFAASLANRGPGPVLVEPVGPRDCGPGRQAVRQVLARDADGNGRFETGRDRRNISRRAGCMVRHPTHDHWHFVAMASYTLRVRGEAEPLSTRRKVSFCLRDNRRVPGVGTSVRREWFGECTARSGQGISPGWADVYGADLDGQSLRLPPRADDRLLCLELVADPLQRLAESREADNATSIALRVRGDRVRPLDRPACG